MIQKNTQEVKEDMAETREEIVTEIQLKNKSI
jgi:hypothetical protein